MAARSVLECGAAGAQGWNIDYLALSWSSHTSTCWFQQWNVVVVGWVPDTLLGPEGSDDACRPGFVPGVWCVPAGFFWSWAPPIVQLVWVGCGVPVVF